MTFTPSAASTPSLTSLMSMCGAVRRAPDVAGRSPLLNAHTHAQIDAYTTSTRLALHELSLSTCIRPAPTPAQFPSATETTQWAAPR